MRLLVPPLDPEPWPSLGGQVCDWIEAHLVHGPGDILGEPAQLTEEMRFFLWRAYEVYPRGHPQAGRRRFKRVVLSRRKGTAKTELAAWIAIAEMDPNAPVRCDGWRRDGREWIAVGRPVHDPYIPMVAVTEEQTEDLAYGAVYEVLTRCDLGNDYDVGLDRVMHRRAPGKLQALASAPSARDGARTSFQHADETHLFILPRLKRAWGTMLRNIPKRLAADAWSLETTTMYAPGEGSVAEESHRYALEVDRGGISDSRLLFDHLQADERWDLESDAELREAIRLASGDAWVWTDVESVVALARDPQTPEPDFRRFWLNQPRKPATKWLDVGLWNPLASDRDVEIGERVVLAFDGSYNRDSTALVGATVEEHPHMFVVKAWERPLGVGVEWRTPRSEVDAEIFAAMERFEVTELACDPPGWHREVEDWEATYEGTVVRFETNQPARMGPACDEFYQAVCEAQVTQDGSEVLRRHLANCVPARRGRFVVVTKSAPDSPDKIDAAVGVIVAHHRARWHHAHPQERDLGAILVDVAGERV